MSEIRKRKKGQVLNNNERQLILNLMSYQRAKNSDKSISEIIREISKSTGCSERTIYKIRKEASKGITILTKQTRSRKKENKNSRNVKYDSFVKSLIRKKVYNFFLQNIPPTLNAILSLVNGDPDLPNFKRSTLHTLLKEIGFVYEQRGKKSLLTENGDAIKFRLEYLKHIHKFRAEKRQIIYTGQTLISLVKNEVQKDESVDVSGQKKFFEHAVDNSSACDNLHTVLVNESGFIAQTAVVYTIDSTLANNISHGFINLNSEQAVVEVSLINNDNTCNEKIVLRNSALDGEPCPDLCADESITHDIEIKNKNFGNKELYLKIMHAGGDQGFLRDTEFFTRCKNKNEEIDSYEHWFIEKLLPKIPPNSVIVTDINAMCKKKANVPDNSWKKQKIKAWLLSENVNVKSVSSKKGLLALVNNVQTHRAKNKVNELAEQKGITIISLPPFHYELNPLNLIWAQIKHYVRSNLKSFKINKIKQLIKEGLYSVTQINWTNCMNHVRQSEDLLQTIDELEKNKLNRSPEK